MSIKTDRDWMAMAIRQSAKGFPAPNPHVGCVIVNHDQVVGLGYHAFAGGAHAERIALDKAGSLARGSSLYVTLEPCRHYGKTPPCVSAIVEAGVRRVVFAVRDPNPSASGGADLLQSAGVEVVAGLLEAEASKENSLFLDAFKLRRPVVAIKAATTLDGRIALPSGQSKWITGEKARAAAHRLRAEYGSVLVGRKTVEKDDPSLTVRVSGAVNQPLRIVLDPHSRLTGSERIFDDQAETLHVVGSPIDLNGLLARLWERGIKGVLVEGGGITIGHFFTRRLADRLELFMAPMVFGAGVEWIQCEPPESLERAVRLDQVVVRQLGEDRWIRAKVGRGQAE